MKKKDDIKDEMHLMLKKEKKLFYAERRLEEKKLRDKGEIGGWNTTKGWTDPLQWMDSSAGRWWAKQDKKWKKRHLEIRAEYAGELKTTFPEFFDGDPSTSAGATFPDDVFMAKSDEETDNMALERHKAMLAEGELSDADLDADIKELQKGDKKIGDGPSHLEGQRTSVPLPDGILQPSKQVSRNNNEQKLQSISSSTDDQPNIEVLPVMGQTQQSGQSEPLNRGSAAEIPALMTSNSSNDYRYFYTHIYQQGND